MGLGKLFTSYKITERHLPFNLRQATEPQRPKKGLCMCAQRRFRSDCAFAQSDLNLRWEHFEFLRMQNFFTRTMQIWSDCTNAQTGLSLCCAHLSEGTFSHVEVQIFIGYDQSYSVITGGHKSNWRSIQRKNFLPFCAKKDNFCGQGFAFLILKKKKKKKNEGYS